MVQPLHTPSVSVTPIDRYRSFNQTQSRFDAPKQSRKRGVVLSQQGWQKLVQAEVLHDRFGKRYTHEQLSERSLLDVRTISRILSCEVKVDKSTLRTFFRAFNLQLNENDYTTPTGNATDNQTILQLSTHSPSVAQATGAVSQPISIAPELMPLVEELLQLKQRMVEDYDRFFHRLGLEEQLATDR